MIEIAFFVGRRCAACCDPAARPSRPHNSAPQRSLILIRICLYIKKQICNLRPSWKPKRYFHNLVAAFVSQSMSAITFLQVSYQNARSPSRSFGWMRSEFCVRSLNEGQQPKQPQLKYTSRRQHFVHINGGNTLRCLKSLHRAIEQQSILN